MSKKYEEKHFFFIRKQILANYVNRQQQENVSSKLNMTI